MEKPFLSIVIPAYNEAIRIESTLEKVITYLNQQHYTFEVVVVDDGSTDTTADLSAKFSRRASLQLLQIPHGGKGWAVQHGMLRAQGKYRFLCDADLSMPIDNLARFFAGVDGHPEYDVAIASREAPGARRFNEPKSRHVKGRLFNYAVKILALRGIEDTQCGFKLFSAESATRLFPHQSLEGWAFDVELLVMAEKAGFGVGEVPIDWYYGEGSKMTLAKGIVAVLDVAKVGLNNLLGRYGILLRNDGS